RLERKRTGPEEWLVVTRGPLTDDRTWEPCASRDATDQDERYRYHYYLTPTAGCAVAFTEPSLGELARVIKAGACIEAASNDAKVRWAWMPTRCVSRKAGSTTWPYP